MPDHPTDYAALCRELHGAAQVVRARGDYGDLSGAETLDRAAAAIEALVRENAELRRVRQELGDRVRHFRSAVRGIAGVFPQLWWPELRKRDGTVIAESKPSPAVGTWINEVLSEDTALTGKS